MSKTNREIRGIDKAGQKDLWVRSNPGQTSKGFKPSGDLKPRRSFPKQTPKSKSLND